MAHVVFLRGVNLGGKVFRPRELAARLKDLEVRSIQAAGTFVVGASIPAAALRRRIIAELPFECVVIVRPATEVAALVDGAPFGKAPAGARPFVSVLAKEPGKALALPLDRPEGRPWEVRLVAVQGHYALSWRRGVEGARLYPNEVVEKALGVPATTRGWATLQQVHKVLDTLA